MKNLFRKKKGQEEMVGFILIVVFVSVILLVFLGISLQNKDAGIESQEVEKFISSFLPYTTDCKIDAKNVSIKELIFKCGDNLGNDADCSNGRTSCRILEDTLEDIVEVSWNVGDQYPDKGYELTVLSNDRVILSFADGSPTNSYKGSFQNFAKGSDSTEIIFRVYS